MDYMKQLNKIAKAIEEIPYTEIHIDIRTEKDTFIIDKIRETKKIGFEVGEQIGKIF